MKTKVIEVTNGFNWGKFLLGRMDSEWRLRTGLFDVARQVTDEVLGEGAYDEVNGPDYLRPGTIPLLRELGWGPEHLWVLDLQTGEGAFFRVGGYAKADLDKHAIWVCPMFQPFLEWVYRQDLSDLDALPTLVTFTEEEAPSHLHGYRRPGPTQN